MRKSKNTGKQTFEPIVGREYVLYVFIFDWDKF